MACFKETNQECPPFCNPFCTPRQISCRLDIDPRLNAIKELHW
jgi:hypothetical protein